MKRIITFLALFWASYCAAQTLPPKQAYPFNIKQLHVGHSLTDPLFAPWPGQYNGLVGSANNVQPWQSWGEYVGSATLPGSWIRFHWDTTQTWCGTNPSVNCYEANMRPLEDIHLYRIMVITENNYGAIDLNVHQSREHLSNFVNRNWQYGNNGQGAATLLWTNWGGLDNSPNWLNGFGIPQSTTSVPTGWRRQLDSMEVRWHLMQDYANQHKPTACPHVYIIPGNRMMARFYDDVQANLVPGITNVSQIFTDGVHLNDLGAYMVTIIHYACIFNANPVGLSNQLLPSVSVPSQFATYVQNMVWNLVNNYPRAGINTGSSNPSNPGPSEPSDPGDLVSGIDADHNSIRISPNPTKDFIYILSPFAISEKTPILIQDVTGKKVMETPSHPIDVRTLPKGVYFLSIGLVRQKFVKE